MSGFDLDRYVQENEAKHNDFDLDRYVQEHEALPTQQTSAGMSALEHYGNTATMGYLPHLQALAEGLMPDPGADVDEELRKKGFKIEQAGPKTYVERRDENRKRLELEAKEHPTASLVGDGLGIVGGSLVTNALMPGAAAATGVGRLAQGVKTGAAMGAVANPGDVEGEVDPLQLGDRAKNAALGGAVGGGAVLAADGVGYAADKVGNWFRDKASLKAARALGRPTPTMAQKMEQSGADKELGRMLLDNGAIPVLGTPKRIAGKVTELRKDAGKEIGDLIDKGASAGANVDTTKLAVDILNSPELALMRKTPGMESTVAAIEQQVETLASNGTLGLKEAHELRQSIDKAINYNKANPAAKGGEVGLKMQRSALSDEVNNQINALNPQVGTDALKAANKQYSKLADADKILEREFARQQANRAISLTDTITGTGGAVAGFASGDSLEDRLKRAAIGGSLAFANKAGRTFGNSMQARGYDSAANALLGIPRFAQMAQNNPAAFQMLANRMTDKASGGPSFERAQEDPLFRNPQIMELFQKNPGLIDSVQNDKLRAQLNKRFSRNPAEQKPAHLTQPMPEDQAREQFLRGN